MATENKYQKSIDRLNQAIGKEIATTLQYLYFHVHFEDDGYEYFSKMMKQTSRCSTPTRSPTASSSCKARSR